MKISADTEPDIQASSNYSVEQYAGIGFYIKGSEVIGEET